MILLFGATGQLGRRLQALAAAQNISCTALSRKDCDFLRVSRKELEQLVNTYKPTVIINAAAFTAVDEAEKNPAEADRVNSEVPGWLAAIAHQKKIPLLHFSTDYVFDGARGAPYAEDAKPNPLNRYGEGKLAGERAVLAAHPGAYIFRLQWLYDAEGKNFLRTMRKLMAEQEGLRVIADQLGTPTAAGDAARAVLAALPLIREGKLAPGIYHLVAGGHTSWHGFACAILEGLQARAASVATKTIEPIVSAEYPLPAPRPRDARLSPEKLARAGISLPHWRDGLANAMEELREAR